MMKMSQPLMNQDRVAVENFQKYLRIPSVHPNVDYTDCVQFLADLGEELQLPVDVIYVDFGKPVVLLTLKGTDPHASSILLNSHMDVVPVHSENWTHSPFGAEKDVNGNIYARGAQDTKCIGIQYIEAVRKYINEKLNFKRTVIICFVPDEEIGGEKGMAKFVQTEDFKKLNVGFVLDEGLASPVDDFLVFYAERAIWQLKITCTGQSGHGSRMFEDTAAEKIAYVIDKFLEYRKQQKLKLQDLHFSEHGKITSVNLTILSGGISGNVVPAELTVTFDIRVGIDEDHNKLKAMFLEWFGDSSRGIHHEFILKTSQCGLTKLDSNNPWWTTFSTACNKLNMKLIPSIAPGVTDSRYLRKMGIPAIGFAPMNHTPVLLHDADEFLNEGIFLRGIAIYYEIIKQLASV